MTINSNLSNSNKAARKLTLFARIRFSNLRHILDGKVAMGSAKKPLPTPANAEKQETLLTLSILTLAAILCE